MAWSEAARQAAALARRSHPNTHRVMKSQTSTLHHSGHNAPTRVSPAVLYRMFNPPNTKLGRQVKKFLKQHPGGRF